MEKPRKPKNERKMKKRHGFYDTQAKKDTQCMEINTIESQNNMSIPLSNLESYLKLNLANKWYQSKSKSHNESLREKKLQCNPSNLKDRIKTPRQLQTLFSRCRCDRSESVGKYPRKFNNVLNTSCRFCDSCEEFICHLMSNCLGTF